MSESSGLNTRRALSNKKWPKIFLKIGEISTGISIHPSMQMGSKHECNRTKQGVRIRKSRRYERKRRNACPWQLFKLIRQIEISCLSKIPIAKNVVFA